MHLSCGRLMRALGLEQHLHARKAKLGGITAGPVGVFVAPDDRIYVTSLSDRIHVFTTTGQFLYRFGITGSEPGDFIKPHGMAMDSQGFFYVADAGNQRIQKFKLTSSR